MANDWFDAFTRLAKGTKARADSVNSLFDLLVTGMDKMPSEAQMNRETRNYAANTGPANAYACSLSHVATAYQQAQRIVLFVDSADANTTAACTLNVSTIGNVAIKYPDGNDPAIGDVQGMCEFRYTGSVWHFMSTSVASVAASAASAASASNNADYAEEWATKAEDSLISAAAGGDESTDYSALHHAAKAAASAAELQSQSALTYNATTGFDFDGNQTQVMAAVTGNLTTLTTVNRADGKSFTVLLIASDGDRTITYNASWRQIGYLPTTITAGKALLITFVCTGTAETDVFVCGALEQ